MTVIAEDEGLEIGIPAEYLTAIGTMILALATAILAFITYLSTKEVERQNRRDRIAKEMDFLIAPLMFVYIMR